MTCRVIVLTALLAALLLSPAAHGQDKKVLGKTQAEWTKILAEHKETRYRRAAVLALGSADFGRTKEIAMALTRALASDSEPEIRREIAATLGSFEEEGRDCVDALAQRLERDDSPKVREAAARSLGRLAGYATVHIPRLGKALKDADPETRTAAAEALVEFGDKAKKVLPQITETAANPNMEVFTRVYAVRILARLAGKDAKTAKLLTDILAERGTAIELRQATVSALGTMGPDALPAVSILAQTFAGDTVGDKQNREVLLDLRRTAGASLGKIGPKAVAALPAILKVMRDPDISLRTQAVRLSGIVGKDNADVARELVEILREEKNAEVLVAAIQESAELRLQIALPQLTELANDPRATIRTAAELSLKKFQEPEKKGDDKK